MSKLKVYIAGPMRGLPDWNFPAFEHAANLWEAAGWHVFSPAAVAVSLGYGLRPRLVYNGEHPYTERAQPTTEEGKAHLQHVILSDVAALFASDAIALLSGWERSVGSTVELSLSQFLGLPSYCAETMQRIYPPRLPWSCLVHGTTPSVPPYDPVLGLQSLEKTHGGLQQAKDVVHYRDEVCE